MNSVSQVYLTALSPLPEDRHVPIPKPEVIPQIKTAVSSSPPPPPKKLTFLETAYIASLTVVGLYFMFRAVQRSR